MRDPRGWMEFGIDAVAAPCRNDGAVPGLGMLLNDATKLANRRARFHDLDSLVQSFSRSLNNPDSIRIRFCLVTHIVGFVEIRVIAPVVQRDVEVENITVQKNSLIGDTVTDNFIGRRTQ